MFDALTQAALQHADVGDVDGVPFSVVRADYLAVIALSVGRAKDLTRVLALLESESVSAHDIELVSAEHGLLARWHAFKERVPDV